MLHTHTHTHKWKTKLWNKEHRAISIYLFFQSLKIQALLWDNKLQIQDSVCLFATHQARSCWVHLSPYHHKNKHICLKSLHKIVCQLFSLLKKTGNALLTHNVTISVINHLSYFLFVRVSRLTYISLYTYIKCITAKIGFLQAPKAINFKRNILVNGLNPGVSVICLVWSSGWR